MTHATGVSALCRKTAAELCAMLAHGEVSSMEITSAYLQSIALQNGQLNAYLEVFAADALSEAAASDARRRAGAPLSPLDGIPIAVKDQLMMRGRLCTCASRMLADFISPYNATVILKLKAAGLPILGRLNLKEFGITGEHEDGAATVVATGMAPFALGSGAIRSIRTAAPCRDLLGVKPAYGTVSRYGLAAYASSFDQIGPLAKTARDAALLMNVIAGPDPKDATTGSSLSADFSGQLPHAPSSLRGLHIGLPCELWGDMPQAASRLSYPKWHTLQKSVQCLREMGAEAQSCSLPALRYAVPSHSILASAEAASNLARFDGIRYGHQASGCADLDALYRQTRTEGLGEEIQLRILWGMHTLSGEPPERPYDKAREIRALLLAETLQVLLRFDALLMPIIHPSASPSEPNASTLWQHMDDPFAAAADLTGLPALSLSCDQTESGLPAYLGLMGAKDSLPRLLAIASVYEHAHLAQEGGQAP